MEPALNGNLLLLENILPLRVWHEHQYKITPVSGICLM
jgi:hypothetical protein